MIEPGNAPQPLASTHIDPFNGRGPATQVHRFDVRHGGERGDFVALCGFHLPTDQIVPGHTAGSRCGRCFPEDHPHERGSLFGGY